MPITTTSEYSDVILSEMLTELIIEEARPPMVASNLINKYSIVGQRTGTKKLNRWDDTGPATAATEGVAFTTTVSLGTSPVTFSPTEGAVQMALVTWDAVEERTGLPSVLALWQQQGAGAVVQAMSGEVRQLLAAVSEKVESDVTALFSGASQSVGSSGVDFSLANFDAGLLLMESVDVPMNTGPIVCCLDREQRGNLRTELMVTSGGVSGNIWDLNLASIIESNEAIHVDGMAGRILGVDTFVHGIGARQTANAGADVVGAFLRRGSGAPQDGGGGEDGALALVEGRQILVSAESDHRERAVELQANYKFAVGEVEDEWIVSVITDAP